MAQLLVAFESLTNQAKVIEGEVTMDGTAPTSVNCAGKLRTIVAVVAQVKKSTAPGVTESVVTYNVAAGTPLRVDLYPWKVTSNVNATLVTGVLSTLVVSYMIFGY